MGDDIEILGIRTRLANPKAALAELQEFARARGGWGQILDAGHVVGRDHIASAYAHARRAIEAGRNTTDSLEMELLLYASGERQISRAIDRVGVRAGAAFVAILGGRTTAADVLARFRWVRDDRLLEPRRGKLRALGYSEAEIRAAGDRSFDLVLERIARVDLIK